MSVDNKFLVRDKITLKVTGLGSAVKVWARLMDLRSLHMAP